MRLYPSLENVTSDRLFSLDVALVLGEGARGVGSGRSTSCSSGGGGPQVLNRVAVEANGPQHYLRTHPNRLEGPTGLRARLLRARGWLPLHVHYADWQQLGGDLRRQRGYLRSRLKQVLRQQQQQWGQQWEQDVTS